MSDGLPFYIAMVCITVVLLALVLANPTCATVHLEIGPSPTPTAIKQAP